MAAAGGAIVVAVWAVRRRPSVGVIVAAGAVCLAALARPVTILRFVLCPP